LPEADAELVGDDVRERRLAEPGRAEQEDVVHRLAAALGRADEDLELLARLRLADVLGERLRAQGPLDRFLGRRAGNAAHDPRVQRRAVGAGPSGREVVGLDAHAPLSNPRRRRLFDNRTVPRTSSRLTVWLFAALLLAKGAVPFLASAAAELHGKGVADICPIYGVALPAAPAVDPHASHHHLLHASHGDDAGAPHDSS